MQQLLQVVQRITQNSGRKQRQDSQLYRSIASKEDTSSRGKPGEYCCFARGSIIAVSNNYFPGQTGSSIEGITDPEANRQCVQISLRYKKSCYTCNTRVYACSSAGCSLVGKALSRPYPCACWQGRQLLYYINTISRLAPAPVSI